jgi:hypothetical protein
MIVLPTGAHEAARGAVAASTVGALPSPARVAHLHLDDPASSDQGLAARGDRIDLVLGAQHGDRVNLLVLHREPRMMAAGGVQEDRTRRSSYRVVQ